MKKKNLVIASTLVVVCLVTLFFYQKKNVKKMRESEPQHSVEEVLKERSQQAKTHLDQELGKIFLQKNWNEFGIKYKPNSQFIELAEIIRACFIGQEFKSFNQKDMEEVMALVVNTITSLNDQDLVMAGLLITQFERLATPVHGSQNYKKIESWFNTPSDFKKRMTVLKLGVHDDNPEGKWVQTIIQGITGKTYSSSRASWFQMINDMRSMSAKNSVLKTVAKDFNKIHQEAKPEALMLLSQNPGIADQLVKETSLKYLHSKDQLQFESGLRSMYQMGLAKKLSPIEIDKIKTLLNQLPSEVITPFVELKVKEFLFMLK